MDSRLIEIAREFSPCCDARQKIEHLYREYRTQQEFLLLDTVITAAGLHGLRLNPDFKPQDLSPELQEAFQLAYPNVPLSSLHAYSEDQLQGFIQGWKGKYFEVLVRDLLNAGKSVGDLHLEVGQRAVLAGSANQVGWDLEIINADGSIAHLMQLKATSNLEYIRGALVRYPQISILATDEGVPIRGSLKRMVQASGISNEEVHGSVALAIDPLMNHSLLDAIEILLPCIPYAVIAATEAASFWSGKHSLRESLERALERFVASGVATSAHTLLDLAGMGLISMPGAVVSRLSINRYFTISRIEKRLESRITDLRRLTPTTR